MSVECRFKLKCECQEGGLNAKKIVCKMMLVRTPSVCVYIEAVIGSVKMLSYYCYPIVPCYGNIVAWKYAYVYFPSQGTLLEDSQVCVVLITHCSPAHTATKLYYSTYIHVRIYKVTDYM